MKLNVRMREELDAAIEDVLKNARAAAPNARIEGVIVSEMVTDGFELLAGVVNDAVFGPVVVAGDGGITPKRCGDTSCRLAPFDEQTVREMIDELEM